MSFHIDLESEVMLLQPSRKDFQDISYTMRGPLPATDPAARVTDKALPGCNSAARLHELHSSQG